MRGFLARSVLGGVSLVLALVVTGTAPVAPPAAAEGLAGFDFDPFWSWTDVAAGDLDRDGLDDLCGVQVRIDHAPPHRARIVPFLQDATRPGRFRRMPAIPVGTDAWRVRLADVDGDGQLDAVTANSDSRSVTVVLLRGAEAVRAHTYRVRAYAEFVEVGDIDGDALPDVVACTPTGTRALLQDPLGPGAFLRAVRVGPDSMAAAVGEFAGGTLPDLALAGWNGSFTVQTDRTDAGPAATTRRHAPRGWQSLAVADLDGDGRAELIRAGGGRIGPRRVMVYTGAPDGDAAPVVSRTRTEVTWMQVADFDRDGHPDLAYGNHARVGWMRQDPAAPGRFVPVATRGIGRFKGFGAVGDFNGDGLPDIAFAGTALSVVLQDPDHTGRLLQARRLAGN